MFIFLSDTHWTDGASGETIHSGAFRGFVQDLRRMAKGWKIEQWSIRAMKAWWPVEREFISWHVLTFVCFYRPIEDSDHLFEVWNGALGTRG